MLFQKKNSTKKGQNYVKKSRKSGNNKSISKDFLIKLQGKYLARGLQRERPKS